MSVKIRKTTNGYIVEPNYIDDDHRKYVITESTDDQETAELLLEVVNLIFLGMEEEDPGEVIADE